MGKVAKNAKVLGNRFAVHVCASIRGVGVNVVGWIYFCFTFFLDNGIVDLVHIDVGECFHNVCGLVLACFGISFSKLGKFISWLI